MVQVLGKYMIIMYLDPLGLGCRGLGTWFKLPPSNGYHKGRL